MMKDSLRKELLEKRIALARSEMLEKGSKITTNLFKLDGLDAARVILAYLPIKAEVETAEIIKILSGSGKKIAIPSIRHGSIVPVEFEGFNNLKEGYYGTLEPVNRGGIPKGKIDVALIPGVAFDERCNRIGYGKGFYDKFLRDCAAVKVGLAYDFQVRPEIPTDKNDVKMDKIVTESRTIGVDK